MLNDEQLESFYKQVICGHGMYLALQKAGLEVDEVEFRHWLLTDEARKNRYYDCQQLGIECLVDYAVETSRNPAIDILDRQITLKTVQFVAQTRSRERYGAHVKHENTLTVDLTSAMQAAEKRLEKEVKVINELPASSGNS